MKILIISQERRYERIVAELRKSLDVDYLFRSSQLRIDNGDYHIPKLFGFNLGFRLLACLFAGFLLVTGRYDVCMADYKCISIPTIFPLLRKLCGVTKTRFIYDIRTIPVDYGAQDALTVEKRFSRRLRFADAFYQGITVITREMLDYLQKSYLRFTKPVGIWETGVDTTRFKPVEVNRRLKEKLGFSEDDFVCFYHGTLTDRRGVIELAESFRIIRSRVSCIKLLLLGAGETFVKVQKIIEEHRLQDTIRLHGWVDYDQVPEFISIADLCVVPLPDIDWWRVSSPFKLMEYIACGKNILLTDMVAHRNVVGRDEQYFWTREATPESFAEGIAAAYAAFRSAPPLFYQKGLSAREKYVDKIGWENRSRALLNFLHGLTGSMERGPSGIEGNMKQQTP